MIPPAYLAIPARASSAGAEVVDLMALVGRPPDAEQAFALDVMLSESVPGRWAALEFAIVEARQNGKTGGVLLPAAIADLFLFGAEMVIWTAHRLDTCIRTFTDLKNLIDGCADLSRRVKSISEGKGLEAIELVSGARMEFKARSVTGGRGFFGDSITFDEALFLVDSQLGALVPTLSTRQNAQIRYGGSAGLATSVFWRSVRDRGRRADPGIAYAEWCMPRRPCEGDRCMHEVGAPGCALDDEKGWKQANHTLGERITYEFMRNERRMLPAPEFAREILGWWDEPDGETRVTPEAWAGAADLKGAAVGRPMFGVDASWGLRSAAIVAATWDDDGTPHVETVAYEQGSEWLPLRLQALKKKHRGRIAMPRSSPAVALLPEILALKLDPYLIGDSDMSAECTAIEAALLGAPAGIRHPGDRLIEMAIRGASSRIIGDGGWTWTRRGSTSDIAPVVAMTAALRGLRLYVKPAADLMNSFG